MSNIRLAKNVTAYYESFEELAKAFGVKPNRMQTNDKEKLEIQREKFCSKHLCKACKKPMEYVGGNMMCCKNEKCNGIKHESKDEETNGVKVWYTSSYDLLDEKGEEIASNIFS